MYVCIRLRIYIVMWEVHWALTVAHSATGTGLAYVCTPEGLLLPIGD